MTTPLDREHHRDRSNVQSAFLVERSVGPVEDVGSI
jgi:hypothetical protein